MCSPESAGWTMTDGAAMSHQRIRRFLGGLSDWLVRLLFRIRYSGLEHIPARGPAILVANHTSMLDMFAIHGRVGPWIHWVAKKELFRSRFMADLLLRLGCIPVDRDKADLAAARGIMTVLRQDGIVGMFPQGTRVRPDQVDQVRPRSGAVHFALRTGVPLLPVAIRGRFRVFSRVQVIFGKPFVLSGGPAPARGEDELHRLSRQVMQTIYSLGDEAQP